MKVTLKAHTPNPLMVVGEAAHTCYSSGDEGPLTPYGAARIVEKCIRSGHHSVLEHAVFTFEIEGVSRALSHQLVRHRIASYSQQSQRYVKMGGFDYVIPISIKENRYFASRFKALMDEIADFYGVMTDNNIPAEDARMVLPNACTTRITVTMNVRALFNFFAHRLCNKAQWEIRAMATEMYKECVRVFPEAFEFAGPPCCTDHCREMKPCGQDVHFGPRTLRRDGP